MEGIEAAVRKNVGMTLTLGGGLLALALLLVVILIVLVAKKRSTAKSSMTSLPGCGVLDPQAAATALALARSGQYSVGADMYDQKLNQVVRNTVATGGDGMDLSRTRKLLASGGGA
jgi:hypothetical protein